MSDMHYTKHFWGKVPVPVLTTEWWLGICAEKNKGHSQAWALEC